MSKQLEGKVAIVTGSGQGIGKAMALVLAREGAKVITNDLKPQAKNDATDDPNLALLDEKDKQEYLALRGDADSTANEIISVGGEAIAFYGDVTDYDKMGELIQKAIDTYGRIDILINNAAGLGQGTLAETTEADWNLQTVSKLNGSFNCMKHAVPYMIDQKFGRVVNFASDAWVGRVGLAAAATATSGVVGLTKATSKELFTFGVTVNAICPQAKTPGSLVGMARLKKALQSQGVKLSESMLKKMEMDWGPIENLAIFVAYLATEEAGYINGAVFSLSPSGRYSVYSEPVPIQTIQKEDSPWTVEELIKVVPEKLLKDYESSAARNIYAE